ncbi:MAG: hypothetical protein ABJB32_03465 [Verrucomicrobiota bacterium]
MFRSAPEDRRLDPLRALGAGAIVVGFCLLLLWHDPLLFWNDDYELSILPVFADVARSWSEGHLPLLSPYSWVCSNLAGEFQYGTFSIFVNAAVVLIWKFPLTFPQQAAALSMAHLFLLAAGAFLLARDRNLSTPLSMMVALIASLNGWIICWGATDWFGALAAFTWLPWAWWGLARALDQRRRRWRFLWPAPFVYLLIAGGFPYTVLMLALLIAWLAVKAIIQTRKLSILWPFLTGSVLGVGLSAPAWLALLEYVGSSARATQDAQAHLQWIVPPTALPGFLLPSWTVNWTDFSSRLMPHGATEMACGLVAPVVLIAGLISLRRILVRQISWELGLFVLVLVISMLPSANVFRWSFRWLPFVQLVLAICSAKALRILSQQTRPSPNTARHPLLRLTSNPGVLGLVLVLLSAAATLLWRTTGVHAFPFIWITLAIAAMWALLEMLPAHFPNGRAWTPAMVTLLALLATYFCIPSNCGVPKYNLDQKLIEPSPLDPQRLYLSVYPPAELTYRVEKKAGPIGQVVRPGSTSMWGGIHLVNGYSPILPSGVAREFAFAIHGELQDRKGEYLIRSQAGPDGELARLGVDGIIVASELGFDPTPDSEWLLVYTSDEGRVFHRRGTPLARVRSARTLVSRPNEQFSIAKISRVINARNRLLADVAVPPDGKSALLTISRPYFSGYRASINKVSLKVEAYRGLMPTVEIPAGTQGRLTVVYRPWWLIWGTVFSAASLIIILACGALGMWKASQHPVEKI